MTFISTQTCTTPAACPSRPSLAKRLLQMVALRQQRRSLCNMSAHQRADIGITHAQACTELERPFWDVPASWRK